MTKKTVKCLNKEKARDRKQNLTEKTKTHYI